MEKKFEKGSDEWSLFMDFWNLCQKYWLVENNDVYWEELLKRADEFYRKYKSIPLAGRVIMALIETQEQLLKEGSRK